VKNLDFAFCHDEILTYAKQRLDWKISYTNVIGNILPKLFTLSMMQASYEAILGKDLDKRNFRKKILSLGILSETKEYDKSYSNRPAMLYEFTENNLQIVEML
jgi:8-oxo-dGTP diphosphatase